MCLRCVSWIDKVAHPSDWLDGERRQHVDDSAEPSRWQSFDRVDNLGGAEREVREDSQPLIVLLATFKLGDVAVDVGGRRLCLLAGQETLTAFDADVPPVCVQRFQFAAYPLSLLRVMDLGFE